MSQGLPYSLAQLQQALGYVESSNRYDVLGPPTRNGGRAYGRYQVMDFNVPSWTEQYLGQRMTPEQFLANPEAQDAVFAGRMGEYYGNSTGDPASRVRNAASLWFTGQPYSADTANRSDGYINNQEYGDRVLRALGSAPQGADAMVMTPDPQQQGGLFSGIRNFFGGGQADPNAGSNTDPFANLSRAQRTMLGFAALRDAAASLEGRDSDFFATAMGGFEQAKERERLRAQGEMANRNQALFQLAQLEFLASQPGNEGLRPLVEAQRQTLMGQVGSAVPMPPNVGMGSASASVSGGTGAPARPAGGVELLQPGEAVDIAGRPLGPYNGEPEVVPVGGSAPTGAASTASSAAPVDPIAALDAELAATRNQIDAIIEGMPTGSDVTSGAILGVPVGDDPQAQARLAQLQDQEARLRQERSAAAEAQVAARTQQVESEDAARQARYNRGIISSILQDPALSGVVGRIEGQAQPGTVSGAVLFGEDDLDVLSKIDQLQGQVFLEARDMLRGGGQITDFEGLRAQQALARLTQRGVSEGAYRQALTELDQVFANAEARALGQELPFPDIDTDPNASSGGGQNSGLTAEQQALVDRYSQ